VIDFIQGRTELASCTFGEGTDLQILKHRQLREDPATLRNMGDSEIHDFMGGQLFDLLPQVGNLALPRRLDTRYGLQKGALPCTVRPDCDDRLLLSYSQFETENGLKLSIEDINAFDIQHTIPTPFVLILHAQVGFDHFLIRCNFLGCSLGDHFSVVKHGHPFDEVHQGIHNVFHPYNRDAQFGVDLLENIGGRLDFFPIQSTHDLVSEKELWFGSQHSGHLQAPQIAGSEFVGHGIGRNLHESPQIPNYGPPGKGVRLKPGMVLAIEPMINQGESAVEILEDGWTAVTKDRLLSAHFEHSVAITENGPEILSLR